MSRDYSFDDIDRFGVYDLSCLAGQTILEVEGAKPGSDVIEITTPIGRLVMWHSQNCCECVEVEDVTGDVNDIIGHIVSVAETRAQSEDDYDDCRSQTYTFYEIRTDGGDITIRWYGTSNGYYSESVDLLWIPVGDES